MTITIHQAVNDDVPDICALLNTLISTPFTYAEEAFNDHSTALWLSNRQQGDWPVLMARSGEFRVGLASYVPFRPSSGYRFTVEHSIYVHKAYQRQGVATALMRALINRARLQQRRSLIGAIDSENTKALDFHRRFGFKDAGRIVDAGFKLNNWRTLILLQFDLNRTQC